MGSDFHVDPPENPKTPEIESAYRIIQLENQLVELQEKIQALDAYYQGLFPAWEAKLESAEQMIAALMQGYAELSVNVQSVMDVTFADEKSAVSLKEFLTKNRAKMFEVLQSDGPS
jgi:intein-encoded DNA endonuclease-like protein